MTRAEMQLLGCGGCQYCSGGDQPTWNNRFQIWQHGKHPCDSEYYPPPMFPNAKKTEAVKHG